jgi:hypothetical protein
MGDQAEHSLLSASGSPGWLACYGYLAQRAVMPNSSNPASRKGTAGHDVVAQVLDALLRREASTDDLGTNRLSCLDYIGDCVAVDGDEIEIKEDFAEELQSYVDLVWRLYKEHPDAVLMVEVQVNYAQYLGVEQKLAWGTSDAIIVIPSLKKIIVIDLKTGYRRVVAMGNGQLRLYGLGSLAEVEMAWEIDTVEMMIVQPPHGDSGITSEEMSVADLRMWARTEAAMAAQHGVRNYEVAVAQGLDAIPVGEYAPGEKQCEWCNPLCKGRFQEVVNSLAGGFVDLDAPEEGTVMKAITARVPILADLDGQALGERMKMANFLEDYLTKLRSAVEVRLLAGQPVPGFKIVQGKKGSRAWADEEKAAKTLKRVLGTKDAMTEPKPISPTAAEKFVKAGKLSARQWSALEDLITQKEGGRHVAREDDPRPAISCGPDRSAFAAVEGDDLSHLA